MEYFYGWISLIKAEWCITCVIIGSGNQMACHLSGTKPLPEPMQMCFQLEHQEQISVKF